MPLYLALIYSCNSVPELVAPSLFTFLGLLKNNIIRQMIAKWSRLWLSPAYSWCLCQSHHPLLHLQWPALARVACESHLEHNLWATSGVSRPCRNAKISSSVNTSPIMLTTASPWSMCVSCFPVVLRPGTVRPAWRRPGGRGCHEACSGPYMGAITNWDNLLAASPDIETFTECRQLCIQSEDCPDQVSISCSAHKDLKTHQAM